MSQFNRKEPLKAPFYFYFFCDYLSARNRTIVLLLRQWFITKNTFFTVGLNHFYVDIQNQSPVQKQFTAYQYLINYFKTPVKKLAVRDPSFQTNH